MNQKVTVADLINLLNEVDDKSLPVKCICLLPEEDNMPCQYSSELDFIHLVVDDDGDEVMLTMDFT